VQPPRIQASLHRALTDGQCLQLAQADHAVVTAGHFGHYPVTWQILPSVTGGKICQVAHLDL
jgi:hypothetical protein